MNLRITFSTLPQMSPKRLQTMTNTTQADVYFGEDRKIKKTVVARAVAAQGKPQSRTQRKAVAQVNRAMSTPSGKARVQKFAVSTALRGMARTLKGKNPHSDK